jgi:hypothetical protein
MYSFSWISNSARFWSWRCCDKTRALALMTNYKQEKMMRLYLEDISTLGSFIFMMSRSRSSNKHTH